MLVRSSRICRSTVSSSSTCTSGSTASVCENSGCARSALMPSWWVRPVCPSWMQESTSSSTARTSRIGEGALHAKRQAAFHVRERFPAKCLAEQDLDARKLVAADGDGEVHLAVEDIAVFGHDNADGAKRRKAHERDLLDARLKDRRREDNREAIGKPCKGARGLLEERIEFRGAFAQILGDRSVALLVRKRIICEQIVHEGAVPEIGRDATCRGMGLRDVALVFEDRKLVSDGGRAHAELVALR